MVEVSKPKFINTHLEAENISMIEQKALVE